MMNTTYFLKEQIDKAVEYLLKAINFAKKNSRYGFCGRLLNNGRYMVEHRLATNIDNNTNNRINYISGKPVQE